MALKYPELFKSFKIGNVEIKNKIVMSPMLPVGWFDEDAVITNEIIDYYEERAKGGVGLIFTCGNVPNSGLEKSGITISPFAHPSKFIVQMKKLVDRLHQYGTKLFIQIWFGSGRAMFPSLLDGTPIGVSEGPNRWDPSVTCRAMTKEEIEHLIQVTIEAAVLCKQTGCDGIDINGAYGGYLGDQFTTDAFNKRTDEYGGSIDGQLKVLTDIIKGIKKECGKNFPVTVRFGTKHYIKAERQSAVPGEEYKEFGRDVEESIVMAKKLEEAGYDAFLMGNGSYDSFYWLYPPMYQKDGVWLEDVAKLKGNVNIPIICPGKITRPEMANAAIKNGMVDAVALGRALLADPEWANKAKLGKGEAIRPCIGCNTGCVGRIFAGLPMQCAVNSNLFNEKNTKLQRAEEPKKIAVIGGGIAGMEAARIAAQRGHNVTIYEKKNKLGGVFIAASVPEFKDADRLLLKWYDREIKNAGVKVNYNCELTLEQIEALDVDEIVVATGSIAKIPPIPGVEQDHVITAIEALLGEKEVGENVTIIGGGQVGCELALCLEKQEKKVTIVEFLGSLMSGGKEALCIANKMMLEDMLKFKNVEVLLETKVASISSNAVEVITPSGEKSCAADTVILATGYAPNNSLYKEINSKVPKKVWLLGDAKTPSNIMYAVKDGAAVGKIL